MAAFTISHHGRLVVTLAGPEAELLSRAESASEESLQMLLAKATGNFARRASKPGGKG